jgi:hypothetical protein
MATVDLSRQQAVINANLLVVQSVWKQRFAQFGGRYNEAYASVSKRLTDASKSQDKMLIAILAKVADLAVKPFGIYGQIASVALAGLAELAKSSVHPSSAINLPSPSPLTYAKDLDGAGEKMFEPLFRASAALATAALTRTTMDANDFAHSKSLMLTSPIWFPPAKQENGLIQRRIEIALWAAYFDSLVTSSYESHQLRFLDDIIKYLMDESLVSMRESQGWENYPKPITQGGPGDWRMFLHMTKRFWSFKVEDCADRGWLLPLAEIPANARIQKSVNWTAPKGVTFKAPTKSGKATITIQSVEMELLPALDWADIPVLKGQ